MVQSKDYMSYSQFSDFLNCEARALAKIKGAGRINMQYTLVWEDSYVSGVCKFKAFNTYRYMCDYIAKYFKTGALWNARAINDTKTIWFIDKEWLERKENENDKIHEKNR